MTEDRIARAREVVRFLKGEGHIDGYWFGDYPPEGERGNFWWRKHLSDITAALPTGDAVEQSAEITRLRGEVERLREALEPFAKQKTCDELLRDNSPSEWLAATAERRIELMGERKREHDANILHARSTLDKAGRA